MSQYFLADLRQQLDVPEKVLQLDEIISLNCLEQALVGVNKGVLWKILFNIY